MINNLNRAKATIKAPELQKFKENIFPVELTAEICGVPIRTLSNWDSKDVLPHQEGKNKPWKSFTLQDIFLIKTIVLLRDKNISMKEIKNICAWIKKDHDIHDLMCQLVIEDVYLATDLQNSHLLLSKENFCRYAMKFADTSLFSIKLNPVVNELVDKLRKLKK